MAKQTAKAGQSKFAIVRKIEALLNLGDTGKLDSFAGRVVRTLDREIASLEKNKSTNKFNFKQKLEDLQDNLEDAQAALEDAYVNIPVDKVQTNQAQKDFVDSYLYGIGSAAEEVERIEKRISDAKGEHREQINDLDARIKARKTHSEMIGS